MRLDRLCSAALIFCALFGAQAVSRAAAPGLETGPASPLDRLEKDGEKKPKPKPFKCSAWCSFRDLGAPPPPARKEDPLTEETRPQSRSWTGFCRRGQWATLVLEVKNTTEDVTYKGTARVRDLNPLRQNTSGEFPYTTSYHMDFEVGPLSEKQYHLSVLCPEDFNVGSVTLDITANGYAHTRYVSLSDLSKQDFIVVVSESAGSFRHLQFKRRNLDADGGESTRERSVAVVEPAELPSRWHDLMLADLIVIDGPPREKLSEAQWAALKSYVLAGGHILITAGKDPSRLAGPVEDLAGITVRKMTEAEGLDSVYPPLHPNKPGWRLPLAEVSVNASSKAVSDVRYNQKTQAVELCRRWYGPGSVTFLPFSLSDGLLEHWAGRSDLPLSIIETGRGRSVFLRETDETYEPGETNSPSGYYWPQRQSENRPEASLVSIRKNLDDSFLRDTIVEQQDKPTMLAFLLIYLLCVVPGNYLLFGWFKRREVAWLAVPLWALSFSLLAWTIGYMGKTGQLSVNEVSIVEAGPGQPQAAARTFLGLYAPRRDDYTVRFPAATLALNGSFDVQAAPGHLLNAETVNARNVDLPSLEIADNDNGLTVERLRVQQRATRRLEIVHRASLGEGVDVQMRSRPEAPNVFDIELSNRSGLTLDTPVMVFEGKVAELAEAAPNGTSAIAPGDSRRIEGVGAPGGPVWKDLDAAFFGKKPSFVRFKTHAGNRVEAVSRYVRGHIAQFNSPVLCAWAEKPMLPVALAAGRAKPEPPGQLESVVLLVIPVPLKSSGKASDLEQRYPICAMQNPQDGAVWLPLQNNSVKLARNASEHVVYLGLTVPENHRELQADRLQLLFNAQLTTVKSKGQPPQSCSGELAIRIQRTDGDRVTWEDLASPLFAIDSGKPWKMPALILPYENPRLRAGNVIRLEVKVKSNDPCLFELRKLELRAGRERRSGD